MRLILTQILLLFLPFLIYAGVLVLRQESPFTGRRWKGSEMIGLTLAGLTLVVLFGLATDFSGTQLSGRHD